MSEFAESAADTSTHEAKDFSADRSVMLKKELKINKEKIYIYTYHRYVCKKIKWKSLFESFKFLKSLKIPMSIYNFNIVF